MIKDGGSQIIQYLGFGSTTFENILSSVRVLVLVILVGCKIKDKWVRVKIILKFVCLIMMIINSRGKKHSNLQVRK